jgi:DNA polymerase V
LHAALAGERLRKEKLEAGGIAVHIRTARHGRGPFYDKTEQVVFLNPTAGTRNFINASREALEKIFQHGFHYAKAGIMLFDLTDRRSRQASLPAMIVPDERKEKDKTIMAVLDAVNSRFGRGTVRFGAEGGPDAPWHMKHTRRSPSYTSAWDEIPVVHG